MIKAMIIAPHPDDAELAMGGTIAQMIDAGWDVSVVDLTDGEPTPFGSKKIRSEETQKANHILGIKKRICLGLPNRYLQATRENRRQLAEVIRLHRPEMMFGPVVPDYHPDHVETTRLMAGARFEAKFHKTDMKGQPHWARRQYFYYSIHRLCHQRPSFIVDITDAWSRKIQAIQAYQSQLKNLAPGDTTSVLEKIEVICRYFGQCIGCKFAEAFVSPDPVRVKEIEMLGKGL